MRFGVDVHVVELMVSAGIGMVLSQYLQGDHDSRTDAAVHSMAAAGTYLVCKMGYTLARGLRQMVMGETNTDEARLGSDKLKKLQ